MKKTFLVNMPPSLNEELEPIMEQYEAMHGQSGGSVMMQPFPDGIRVRILSAEETLAIHKILSPHHPMEFIKSAFGSVPDGPETQQ